MTADITHTPKTNQLIHKTFTTPATTTRIQHTHTQAYTDEVRVRSSEIRIRVRKSTFDLFDLRVCVCFLAWRIYRPYIFFLQNPSKIIHFVNFCTQPAQSTSSSSSDLTRRTTNGKEGSNQTSQSFLCLILELSASHSVRLFRTRPHSTAISQAFSSFSHFSECRSLCVSQLSQSPTSFWLLHFSPVRRLIISCSCWRSCLCVIDPIYTETSSTVVHRYIIATYIPEEIQNKRENPLATLAYCSASDIQIISNPKVIVLRVVGSKVLVGCFAKPVIQCAASSWLFTLTVNTVPARPKPLSNVYG